MSRFVFPQPPPARLVFQPQQQQQISPLQLAQIGLMQQKRELEREQLARQAAREQRQAIKDELQIRKLQGEEAERLRGVGTRTAKTAILRSPRGSEKRAVAENILRGFDPDEALNFATRQADALEADNNAIRSLSRNTTLTATRASRRLLALKGVRTAEQLADWRDVNQRAVEGGFIPPGLLPETRISDADIDAERARLDALSRAAATPDLFDLKTKIAQRVQDEGIIVNSPEWFARIKELYDEETANKATRARTPLVDLDLGGIKTQVAVPASEGVQTAFGKQIGSGQDMLGSMLRITELALTPQVNPETGEQFFPSEKLFGRLVQGGFRLSELFKETKLDVLAHPILSTLGLSEDDVDTILRLNENVTQMMDAWRVLVTGLAAPDKELQRIERRIKTTQTFKAFKANMEEFRLRALRAQYVRERILWEGFAVGGGKTEKLTPEELTAALKKGKRGLTARQRAAARRMFLELPDAQYGPEVPLRIRITNRETLARDKHNWNQAVRGLSAEQSMNELWAEGYVERSMAERIDPDASRFFLRLDPNSPLPTLEEAQAIERERAAARQPPPTPRAPAPAPQERQQPAGGRSVGVDLGSLGGGAQAQGATPQGTGRQRRRLTEAQLDAIEERMLREVLPQAGESQEDFEQRFTEEFDRRVAEAEARP